MQTIKRANATPFEVSDRRRVSFYAAVWDSPAVVFDVGPDGKTRIKYRETIRPGAFTHALRTSPDVVADIDHDQTRTFARTSDGTLILQADPHGLYCSAWVPETESGDKIIGDIKNGKLTGCSFHALYLPSSQVWRTAPDGMRECEVTEMYQLIDVCLTGNPAYRDTDVMLRTAATRGRAVAEIYRFRKVKLK